ncbi:MAG: D-alanyl-D-alanine carboxypeptidase family protein [Treponemataceae bacterium]|nr:D-alanyl-D-alanine carboxypeptidase [Spirochaetales bacterium]MDY6031471.1 D-alanyl-D-alanine carboxypeptidase family protein [Treponemataceae bacterium]
MKKIKITKKILLISITSSVALIILVLFAPYPIYIKNLDSKPAKVLTDEQVFEYQQTIKERYPQKAIRPLPYQVKIDELNIHAKSAIAVDFESGCIMYEKNSEEKIPPASMTKLVLMYVALDAISQGKVDYTDIVELPSESWAKNAPPHSSLMFLGEGQHVTLDELITGLNVVSGNDAAVAIAIYIFGSVDECISKMNETVKGMGLHNTHFEEVSGYSEKNITTAKDFSIFCVNYVRKFPFALQKYHSLKSFTYPKAHNLKDGWTYERGQREGIPIEGTMPITQKATNLALTKIPYADGLKTGYIDESGYNLALSVYKDGQRLISVTMGGPGNTATEGGMLRAEDAVLISDWVYKAFSSVPVGKMESVRLKVPGGKSYCCNLIEVCPENHYVLCPNITDENGNYYQLARKIVLDEIKDFSVEEGNQYGKVEYYYGSNLIDTTILVADRTIEKGNLLRRMWAKMAEK